MYAKSEALKALFIFIGEIDSAISIASLRADLTIKKCTPTITSQQKELSAINVYHPLIENCITNSIDIHGKSVFITGSNMSGKSTFLRTILINDILAKTIYTCFADKYLTTLNQPFSSIKIGDNLSEGKSYYFEEVSVMHQMVNQVINNNQNIFIIDEIFKGTNTVERISLAKAVLEYLNTTDNIIIASSHDLELIDLLHNDFEMYYFTETINGNQLFFDHKIKKGTLPTRNARKIIEIEGFPSSLVSDAYLTSSLIKSYHI